MTAGEREKEDKGFTVRDRRHFFQQKEKRAPTEEERREKPEAGEARAQGEEIEKEAEKKEEVREERREEKRREEKRDDGKEDQQEQIPLPEVSFSNFVRQLTLQALIQLGEIQDPLSNETRKSLPLAKHTIDHIAMLKEKTEGNLSQEEQTLVDSALYDLRMRYVKASS